MKTIFIQTHRGNVPVRYHHFAVRNQRWKLVHPTGFGRLAPRDDVPYELYKMAVDPREEKNLAVQYPGVVAQLKDAYDIRFDDVSTTRPDNYDPPRIVVGTDHETRTVLTWEDWRVTDDAGWGRNGKWLLRVETERTYDIELVWPEAIDPAKIEVQIGPVRAELELTRRAEKAVLRDVRIPPGEADLTATIIRNGDREGAYHVILVRR